MGRVSRAMFLSLACLSGCAEGARSTPRADLPGTESDASDPTPEQNKDAAAPPGDAKEPDPVDMMTMPDAGSGPQPMPSGDACADAAIRIASCFLTRRDAGSPACASGAADAAPTVARFLIAGGSCETLKKQGITLSTPCDQAPVPMHVTQLAGFEAAASLCKNGPVNSAATCNTACKNTAPCVDSKMLDPRLKDPARCFDGCIRNPADKNAFACSAAQTDCGALAQMCWTE